MDDASAQLSEIAQQLASLAATARKLAEQPLFQPDFPANENNPGADTPASSAVAANPGC